MPLPRPAIAVSLLLAACGEDRPIVGSTDATVRSDAPPGGDGAYDTGPRLPPLDVPLRPLGAGFTDLTAPLERASRFVIPAPAADMVNNDDVAVHPGDLDGDGRDEFVVAQWQGGREVSRAAPYLVLRYDRAARSFAADPSVVLPPMPYITGVFDLDGDGRDDLIALDRDEAIAWGHATGFANASPLATARLDWGQGFRIHNYMLDDLDDDGWIDLLVAVDCCRRPCTDLHALLRTDLRAWTERPEALDIPEVSKPYSAFSARFATGERVLASVGNSCTDPQGAPMFYRASALDAQGYPRFTTFDPTPDDAFFRPMPGRFPTMAVQSPMAACADDVDNDGLLDLGIALDPFHGLYLGRPRWPFADVSRATGVLTANADSGRPMIPWSTVFIDLDRDTRLDWVSAHGNDQQAWFAPPARFIGPQFVTLFQGLGGARFRDVTRDAHLERRGQWRDLTFADWDGDGDADLTVGGQQELPRLYRNDIENGAHGVVLDLRGTTSNHLAVGAWLAVWLDEAAEPLHRYVGGAAHPYSLQAPFVTVGLGAATRIPRLQIRWPSGTVQEVRDLDADRAHTITEPPVLTITPARRHAPADGRSAITLQITPRTLAGALRDDARVEVSLQGVGSLESPVFQGPDGWTALVRSTVRGECVVTVRVDGSALPLRPRLWFE